MNYIIGDPYSDPAFTGIYYPPKPITPSEKTKYCPQCGKIFKGKGIYCCANCRLKAFRQRKRFNKKKDSK